MTQLGFRLDGKTKKIELDYNIMETEGREIRINKSTTWEDFSDFVDVKGKGKRTFDIYSKAFQSIRKGTKTPKPILKITRDRCFSILR